MKKIFLATLIGVAFVNAETSAFGAGNLASNSPYGLTSNEKFFKDKLDALNSSYTDLNLSISSINENIEGLRSILEGLNSQYSKLNSRINNLEDRVNIIENNLTNEINNLKNYIEENRKIQDLNNKQTKKVLAELSSLISSMNDVQNKNSEQNLTIVENLNNKEIENNVSDNNSTLVNTPSENIKKDDSWKKSRSDEILKLGIKDLNEDKFSDAREKFEFLINVNHYKPARATFYLGEIEYKQKQYNNAITYYKKSSAISVKGDYVPKLLYHTAISLDKIGDTKSANKFYKVLKTNYPNTPEAKASPDRK